MTTGLNFNIQMLKTDGLLNVFSANVNPYNDSQLGYDNGNGSQQVNVFGENRYTVTPSSGTLDVDLLAILDPFGVACAFTKIRLLYVKNRMASGGGQLLIGGAAANPWTAPFSGSGAPTTARATCNPGAKWTAEDPFTGLAVTSTSKVLRFTHNGGSSGSIVFDLLAVGIR